MKVISPVPAPQRQGLQQTHKSINSISVCGLECLLSSRYCVCYKYLCSGKATAYSSIGSMSEPRPFVSSHLHHHLHFLLSWAASGLQEIRNWAQLHCTRENSSPSPRPRSGIQWGAPRAQPLSPQHPGLQPAHVPPEESGREGKLGRSNLYWEWAGWDYHESWASKNS